MPSDTIYGLSCRALDAKAVDRLRQLKERDTSKRMIVLVANMEQFAPLRVDTSQTLLVKDYWPGPLTLICSAPRAPLWLHRGVGTFGVRMPKDQALRKLIALVGPIISTSANPAGRPEASSVDQAKGYFGDQLDFFVDAGEIHNKPSTIVEITDGKLHLIRPGAVKITDKRE